MQIPYAVLIALMALSEFCATKSYCQTLLTSLLQGALAERSQEEPHKVLQGALRL